MKPSIYSLNPMEFEAADEQLRENQMTNHDPNVIIKIAVDAILSGYEAAVREGLQIIYRGCSKDETVQAKYLQEIQEELIFHGIQATHVGEKLVIGTA